jgi:hypothetical protein
MSNEYVQALERARKERAELEEQRKKMEAIDNRIRSLDTFILNVTALLKLDSPNETEPSVQATQTQRPNLPVADLIHKVMDELGISTFRIPSMRLEFIKRGWISSKPNSGLILRTAALRRDNEFKLNKGELTRISKPKKPEGLGLLDGLEK